MDMNVWNNTMVQTLHFCAVCFRETLKISESWGGEVIAPTPQTLATPTATAIILSQII